MLHAVSSGAGRRVVLVHGFTQTGASWGAVSDSLHGRFEIVTVDLPGHGDSGPATDLQTSAGALVETGGLATYVGYSLGGRVALQGALAHPAQVERLVLVSSTAGIDDADERATRCAADDALATDLERDGLGAFLDRWLALPLFAHLSSAAAGQDDRLANTVSGLAGSLRQAGTGTMDPPLWHRLCELTMPVLVVVGALDHKFRAIGERLATEIGPNADLAVIADAGHAVHLEQPARFLAAIDAFLDTP